MDPSGVDWWQNVGVAVGAAVSAILGKGGVDWWRGRTARNEGAIAVEGLKGSIEQLAGEVRNARSDMQRLATELSGARRDLAILLGRHDG
jgi:hypothetical protein